MPCRKNIACIYLCAAVLVLLLCFPLLAEGVRFRLGSAEVTDSSGPALREIARQIQESIKKEPGTKIRIIGYTDSLGDSSFNVKLSYQRALAIRNILLKETGIDSSIIEPVGMGSSSPIASNSTPQGRDLNRRVLVEMAHTSINESVGKPYFF